MWNEAWPPGGGGGTFPHGVLLSTSLPLPACPPCQPKPLPQPRLNPSAPFPLFFPGTGWDEVGGSPLEEEVHGEEWEKPQKLLSTSLLGPTDQLLSPVLLSFSLLFTVPPWSVWQLEKVTSTGNPRSTSGMVWSGAERARQGEGQLITCAGGSAGPLRGTLTRIQLSLCWLLTHGGLGWGLVSFQKGKEGLYPLCPSHHLTSPHPYPSLLAGVLRSMVRVTLVKCRGLGRVTLPGICPQTWRSIRITWDAYRFLGPTPDLIQVVYL